MDKPDVSRAAHDEAVKAKASLGIVGRVRLKVAALVLLFGMLLLPKPVRKATSGNIVAKREEE